MQNSLFQPEVAVISDLHLGTYACKAKRLLGYLKSIEPEILVLNGDIFDAWRFSRNYFPKSHLKVVRQVIKMMESGTRVFYITGNHDEFLRKFEKINMGNLQIVNQLTLNLNKDKTWIFHGDIFDKVIHQSKWLAKTGAAAYGLLTVVNIAINKFLKLFGGEEILIFKSIRERFIKTDNQLSGFESSVALLAIRKEVNTIICGHTHLPADKYIEVEGKIVHYLNCGDWVENYSAAEYRDGRWKLRYFTSVSNEETPETATMDKKLIYSALFEQLTSLN